MTTKASKISLLLTVWQRAWIKLSHVAAVATVLIYFLGVMLPLHAQTVIGGEVPDGSAILDIQSTSKGLLLPRLTTDQRNAIDNPQTGLLIYNTSLNCLEINVGTTLAPSWNCMDTYVPGSISTLTCSSAVVSGNLTSDQPASGVSASVPYTGGNGGTHSGQTVTSTGVEGLTATLASGNFASGAGNLVYAITGTPSAYGPAVFALNIGGQNCNLVLTVQAGAYSGTISTLSCSCPKITGTLKNSQPAASITAGISYTAGNGGSYGSQVVASTGVTGLYATVTAGNFNTGSGELNYAISGTPSTSGTANFAISIAGKNCTLSMTVASSDPLCRAKISATEYKNFMCYNLGAANTAADPFTPSWEINGSYWQWGVLAQATAGPSGPDLASANDGAVPGWSNVAASNTAWQNGTKTANDPCPSGYRVPTSTDWANVMANNTLYYRGAGLPASATNYGFGLQVGEELFLPAAGNRLSSTGALQSRGLGGSYWSSTSFGAGNAWFLDFWKCGNGVAHFDRRYGFPIRCIAE